MVDLNALPLPELYAHLNATGFVDRLAELARDEDLGPNWERDGDLTSRVLVPEYFRGRGAIVCRSSGVVSGLATLERVLHAFRADVDADIRVPDGAVAQRGEVIATLEGRTRDILRVERSVLNLVGRLSGVATRTAQFVAAARAASERVQVLDTRKTTPGLRVLEKYAVRCGGGHCHRLGLFDAVMLKDNHLAAAGTARGAELVEAVKHAVRTARVEAPKEGLRFIELEVDDLQQLEAILSAGGAGVDIVLLDNMDAPTLARAVALRDSARKEGRLLQALLLEASGGVTLETIGAIAGTGVDRISAGTLTHGATWLDVALDMDARER